MSTKTISYDAPKPKFTAPPKELSGEALTAWLAILTNGGAMYTSHFDDDWSPIGPTLRERFCRLGMRESTSGRVTIIFLP